MRKTLIGLMMAAAVSVGLAGPAAANVLAPSPEAAAQDTLVQKIQGHHHWRSHHWRGSRHHHWRSHHWHGSRHHHHHWRSHHRWGSRRY
ncbi:MAG: hypothetical protein ACREC6_08635 [Hyphomicrobiaceae bacterium]